MASAWLAARELQGPYVLFIILLLGLIATGLNVTEVLNLNDVDTIGRSFLLTYGDYSRLFA